jgi:hypothetical protein
MVLIIAENNIFQLQEEPRAKKWMGYNHILVLWATESKSLTPHQTKQSRLLASKTHHRSYHYNHWFITSDPISWLTVCFITVLYYFFLNGKTVVAPITWNWPPITTDLFYLRENLLNKNICLKEKRMCHWVSALLLLTSKPKVIEATCTWLNMAPLPSESIANSTRQNQVVKWKLLKEKLHMELFHESYGGELTQWRKIISFRETPEYCFFPVLTLHTHSHTHTQKHTPVEN